MKGKYLSRFDLGGRSAVVTGGSQGIGLACAEALAEAGASIMLAAQEAGALERAAFELNAKGHSVEWRVLDVTSSRDVAALAAELGAFDILVANAGIARNSAAEDITDEEYGEILGTNLNGVYWCCREFGKRMIAKGKGAIINTGSISGYIVNVPQKQSHYNASKAAVHQLGNL